MAVARRSCRILLSVSVVFAACQANADGWTRFRGPNGSGVSESAATTPTEWSPTDLQWKTALPGPGSSCPIVVGDQIFVTCWSGYGTDRENPGDQQQLKRHLISVDRNTGQIQWDKTVDPYLPEDDYGGMFAEHGYASHTPVSDGQNVYVFFGKTGALAFDLEGNQLWHNSTIGTESGANGWGTASSPILYEDLLIVTATAECEGLVALNKHTGEEVWRKEAGGFSGTWGTPVLVEVDDNRTDLAYCIAGEMWGFEPTTGKFLWYCEGLASRNICSSAVAADGVVYAIEAGPAGGGGVAIRVSGSGELPAENIVWRNNGSSRIGSPLVYDGRIYAFGGGQVNCYDASNGEEIYRERLKGGQRGGRGQDYASPILADGKVYFTSRSGDIFVLEAGGDFNQLAVNRVTDDTEDFSATPAVTGEGQIVIRSNKNLYCVASGG